MKENNSNQEEQKPKQCERCGKRIDTYNTKKYCDECAKEKEKIRKRNWKRNTSKIGSENEK